MSVENFVRAYAGGRAGRNVGCDSLSGFFMEEWLRYYLYANISCESKLLQHLF